MNKPAPPGWPRLSVGLYYDDPAAAIGFLEKAFGFVIRLRVDREDGKVRHSELLLDGAVVVVETADASRAMGSPRSQGGVNTQGLFLYIDNVDAHCERARAAGAVIVCEPTTRDHGEAYWTDRTYQATDPEGHNWWFGQRIRTGG